MAVAHVAPNGLSRIGPGRKVVQIQPDIRLFAALHGIERLPVRSVGRGGRGPHAAGPHGNAGHVSERGPEHEPAL
eukprot:2024667-Rhodomonas_salina.2